MTNGLEPYPELDKYDSHGIYVIFSVQAASQVMHKGLTLTPPENTPPKLAELMKSCFEREASKRPNFKKVISVLNEIEEEVTSNPFY